MIKIVSKYSLSVFIWVLWGLFYSVNGYSQTVGIDVYFQDFHNAEVTQIVVSDDGNWFFSADRTGKVLMWNANDFTVYKTLADGYGIPITNMRINPAGNRLIYSTGQGGMPETGKAGNYRTFWFNLSNNFSDTGTADTLYSVPVFANENEETSKIAEVIDVQGYSDDNQLIYIMYGEQPYLLVYNSGELLHEHPVQYTVGQAAYHEEKKLFAISALGEEYIDKNYILELRTADGFGLIIERDFGSNPIVDLRFHPKNEQLFVVVHDTESEAVVVYLYDLNTFSEIDRGVFEYQNRDRTFSSEVAATDISFDNGTRILVTNRFAESFIISHDEEGFSHSVVKEIESGRRSFQGGAYLPLQDRLVVFDGAGSYESPEMIVYDVQRNRFLERFSRMALPKLIGEFLPDDDWLITSQSDFRSFETFIKYYPTGSIMNRFSRNSFSEYIELQHQLNIVQSGAPVDRTTGEIAFLAFDPKTLGSSFYLYDLSEDEVQRHAPVIESYTVLQQFRGQSGRILLSNLEIPTGYAIARHDSVRAIEGVFLQAHLSWDGEYLMTYSEKHEVGLIQLDTGKTVLNHTIDEEVYRFTIHPIDEDGFWLSYSWFDGNSLKNKTLVLTKEEDNLHEITEPEISDYYIEDLTYANDKFAIIVGNYGMIILSNEQILQLETGARPSKVSLNSDGSRLMVSLSDGTIRIYDMDSSEELARMIHPGRQDQLIIRPDGYYSSNTNAGRWLAARTPQGDPLPFYIAEHLNRPDKVISSFGFPKSEMVEMLERAALLRETRMGTQSALQHTEAVPEIVSVLIDGEHNLSVSTQKEPSVTVRLYDESSRIISLRVTLNGVPMQPELSGMPVSPGNPSEVSFILPLVNGENVIQFQAYNSDGVPSLIRERTVEFTSEEKPDLYLLAVGVSEYDNEALNLTFADKDAWDMALLFGDSTSVDLKEYKDTFYGNRYSVENSKNLEKSDNIKLFRQYYYGGGEDLFQTDLEGRFWVEKERGEEGVFWIWDFENLTRRQIPLPDFTEDSFVSWKFHSVKPIPDPAGKEIVYVDTLNQLTFVDNESFFVMKHPMGEYKFDELFAYKPGIFIGQMSYSSMAALETDKPFHRVDITGDSLMITELEIESDGYITLKAVSHDGEMLLVESLSDLKVIYVNDPGLERRLTGFKEISFDQKFAFSGDNKMVKSLHIRTGRENQRDAWVLYERPLNQAEIDSTVIPALSHYHSVNINNIGDLIRMELSPPLARFQSFFDSDRLDVIHQISPVSFEKTHIRMLTNRSATSENVKNEMNNFLKNVRPDDQIVVFLAGHGVLGSDYTYYFAPADMDFDNPELAGIAYDDIISAISSSESTRRLLLMDTCHAGEVYDMQTAVGDVNRFHTESARTIISGQQDLYVDSPADIMSLLFNETGSENGITVLAASGGAEVAYESSECADLNNGAFTSSIIGNITGLNDPGNYGIINPKIMPFSLTSSFIEEVNNQVMRFTCNRQIPNTREINWLSDIRLW